jgi:hypothetical protein
MSNLMSTAASIKLLKKHTHSSSSTHLLRHELNNHPTTGPTKFHKSKAQHFGL